MIDSLENLLDGDNKDADALLSAAGLNDASFVQLKLEEK
jgi:hypothetical protein